VCLSHVVLVRSLLHVMICVFWARICGTDGHIANALEKRQDSFVNDKCGEIREFNVQAI
jgi:hypothetical protein